MRILFVTPRFPYPLLKGDQVVPYHRLRHLSQDHEITLLTLYEREEELEGIQHLQPYCRSVHPVRLSKLQSVVNVGLKAPFSPLPLQALYYQSQLLQSELNRIINQEKFDLIHAYLLRIAPATQNCKIPVILDLIDSMQLNLERRIQKEHPPKKWLYKEELRRVSTYERQLGETFNQMIVVAAHDSTYIPGNVSIVPNGVDTDLFVPAEKRTVDPKIVFSGNMGYAPNIHAVKWFVENCFDQICSAEPNVQFVIAGANPSKEVLALAQSTNIKVTGFVPSMVDILQQSKVAIAPMQTGSGVQNKILEAMSCELPVVTTPLGKGSLSAEPERDIIVAADPEGFSKRVIELLQDNRRSEELGKHARQFVKTRHSWAQAADLVNLVYRREIQAHEERS